VTVGTGAERAGRGAETEEELRGKERMASSEPDHTPSEHRQALAPVDGNATAGVGDQCAQPRKSRMNS
jgi:hypothetical protein